MSFKDAVEIAASVIVSLGGGGAIVLSLSGYLGKVWADRALEKQKQEYARINSEFNHQLDVASRRLQVGLDTLGHLQKLQTQSEFEKVRELWKHILDVQVSLASLPGRGFMALMVPKATRHEHSMQNSQKFAKAYYDAYTFWTQETLSIPQRISDAAGELLGIAREESIKAMGWPDPVSDELLPQFSSEEAANEFFQVRIERMRKFNEGAKALELLMRDFLQGRTESGESTN